MLMRFGIRGPRLKSPLSFAAADSNTFDAVPNFPRFKSDGFMKRGFDIGSAMLALILLLPIFVILTLALLISQGRPIFIRHRRMGLYGVSFECLKFRTMVRNADEVLHDHIAKNVRARSEWETTRKLKDDPRITPIGKVLRRSSIDEIPQLFNIIMGHMSVVGPRPIVRDEIRFYGNNIADYYRVRPGLTGLWQISGRNDLSYVSRVQLDAQYAKSRTFVGDLKIIAKTIPAVVRLEGSY